MALRPHLPVPVPHFHRPFHPLARRLPVRGPAPRARPRRPKPEALMSQASAPRQLLPIPVARAAFVLLARWTGMGSCVVIPAVSPAAASRILHWPVLSSICDARRPRTSTIKSGCLSTRRIFVKSRCAGIATSRSTTSRGIARVPALLLQLGLHSQLRKGRRWLRGRGNLPS